MEDQGRQMGNAGEEKGRLRRQSEAEGVAEPQDIGIRMNTGFKIIANVNSHPFLPTFSPLSLQQAFTL